MIEVSILMTMNWAAAIRPRRANVARCRGGRGGRHGEASLAGGAAGGVWVRRASQRPLSGPCPSRCSADLGAIGRAARGGERPRPSSSRPAGRSSPAASATTRLHPGDVPQPGGDLPTRSSGTSCRRRAGDLGHRGSLPDGSRTGGTTVGRPAVRLLSTPAATASGPGDSGRTAQRKAPVRVLTTPGTTSRDGGRRNHEHHEHPEDPQHPRPAPGGRRPSTCWCGADVDQDRTRSCRAAAGRAARGYAGGPLAPVRLIQRVSGASASRRRCSPHRPRGARAAASAGRTAPGPRRPRPPAGRPSPDAPAPGPACQPPPARRRGDARLARLPTDGQGRGK